ncbi:MAG: hypothetical protein DWQ05_13000 [Calditrichaeota bacterium]|nr:MAG: hypothetical protein DWQ05_13000 [Calditrichota bacterium]
MKIYDEHIHLRFHADEPPRHELAPFIKCARDRKIAISVKEHGPLPKKYQQGPRGDFYFAMSPGELEPFIELFVGSDIPIGLEMDYFIDSEDEIRSIADDFLQRVQASDLTIGALNGSVHLLPLDITADNANPAIVMWDDKAESFKKYIEICGIERIIEEYHKALCGMVKMQLFDVLSHIDLLRKFDKVDAKGKSFYLAGYEKFYEDAIFDVLQLASETDIAVELNTQGIDRPYGRPFLSQKAVEFCKNKKMKLTFASDAHRPEAIGRHFETAGQMFAQAGVDKLVFFRDRIPYFYDYK